LNLLLADLVLIVHVAFALFVVSGLPLIWIGATAGWRWVHHFGLHALLYYDLPSWMFTAAYIAFAAAVALTWWRIPPTGKRP
jgi:hypothetical protein